MDNITNITNINNTIVTVVADHYYEITLEEAISRYGNSHIKGVSLYVGRICISHEFGTTFEADKTFFYAAVNAAEEGKIWVEEVHNFCDQEVINTLEFDEDVILDNIMLDIDYESVTGKDGEAIVKSEKVAKICENDGYKVTAAIGYWIVERNTTMNKEEKAMNNITVTINNDVTVNVETLEEALRIIEGDNNSFITINGIVLPNTDDNTFFYAAAAAAAEGKVWLEELHEFVTKTFKNMVEGGCDDDIDPEKFWDDAVGNIQDDISGVNPVTGADGEAIVYDSYLAEECINRGYEVLPCIDDDGEEFFIIFSEGGEEEYFENYYNNDKDKEDKTMKITKELAHKMASHIKSGIYTMKNENLAWSFERQCWKCLMKAVSASRADSAVFSEDEYNWDMAKTQIDKCINLIGHASFTDPDLYVYLDLHCPEEYLFHYCRKFTADDVIEWFEVFTDPNKHKEFEEKNIFVIVPMGADAEDVEDSRWDYDSDSYYIFNGKNITVFEDEYGAKIMMNDKNLLVNINMAPSVLTFIADDFDANPDQYLIQDARLYHALEEMPFDKAGRNGTLIHATGWELWDNEAQRWIPEYDDEDDDNADDGSIEYEESPLTVSKLIEVLKNFDQNAKVRISNGKVDVFGFAVADDDEGVIFAI